MTVRRTCRRAVLRTRRRAKDEIRSLRYACQRAARGFDDGSVWDLDLALCHTVGTQLIHLADNLRSWPGERGGYSTPEEWEADLRTQSACCATTGISTTRTPLRQNWP
jgi:hypothetical protein